MLNWMCIKILFRVLPLPTWYPYDWTINPAFEWSYFAQTIALCLTDLCYLPTEVIFPYVSLVTTGQFKILGTKWRHYNISNIICRFLGHNFRNILYTTLLEYGLDKVIVFKFKMSFNENFCENHAVLSKHERVIIDTILQKDDFKDLLNNRLNKYIRQHSALLEVCKKIEDTFSPFMLIKIFFNRMYIMMDILCVLYVTYLFSLVTIFM